MWLNGIEKEKIKQETKKKVGQTIPCFGDVVTKTICSRLGFQGFRVLGLWGFGKWVLAQGGEIWAGFGQEKRLKPKEKWVWAQKRAKCHKEQNRTCSELPQCLSLLFSFCLSWFSSMCCFLCFLLFFVPAIPPGSPWFLTL